MVGEKPQDGLQLQSNAKSSGVLEISLARVPVPDPAPDEVVIRIEATPINPSDLGLLIGAADPSTARAVTPTTCRSPSSRPMASACAGAFSCTSSGCRSMPRRVSARS